MSHYHAKSAGGKTRPESAPPTIKPSKEQKKMGRRAKQLETEQKKAAAEDNYFREAQRSAIKSGEAAAAQRGLIGAEAERREQELFEKQGAQGINFAAYDEISMQVTPPKGMAPAEPLGHFEDLGSFCPPFLARNFGLMRYQRPTPIQKHSIPYAIAGADLMCCAQTGSGKTAAFLIPVCTCLGQTVESTVGRGGAAAPRCVAMAPTRELASQIELEAHKLCNKSPLRPVVVYGGADQKTQIRKLAIGCDICVATPGRLQDFVERGIVTLSMVQFLILDEADRMLDMGFEPQIRRLVQRSDMPPKEKRQTLLFSATFAPEIQQLAKEFLCDYVWIAVGRVGSTVESITQKLVQATPDKRQKLNLVANAIREGPQGRTLIFVSKKRSATWLKKMLAKGGPDGGAQWEMFPPITAEDIHGDRSQSQREAALAAFRSGACQVLVATDVAARGLDISGVVHVINMDLPGAKDDFDSYVHRIGRTGRAGHQGLATSLYVPGEDDPKAKNGRIGASLYTLLSEADQEIPAWFAALPETQSAQGAAKGKGGSKAFTSKDVRGANGQKNFKETGRGKGGKGGTTSADPKPRGGNEGGGREVSPAALARPMSAPAVPMLIPKPNPAMPKQQQQGKGVQQQQQGKQSKGDQQHQQQQGKQSKGGQQQQGKQSKGGAPQQQQSKHSKGGQQQQGKGNGSKNQQGRGHAQ